MSKLKYLVQFIYGIVYLGLNFNQHSTGSFYTRSLTPILPAHCVERKSWAYFLAVSKVEHIFVGETKWSLLVPKNDYRHLHLAPKGWWNWLLMLMRNIWNEKFLSKVLVFQTPYYWPSQHHTPDNIEYAIYLDKRSQRNRQKHGLEDYELVRYTV